MNRSILRISLAILILLGFYLLFKTLYIYPKYDGKSPLNVNNIESQTFTINHESDTVLKGSNGTLLKIYKNSFQDCKGNIVQGKVELELKEIVSENDLIFSGLTTTSNGKLLETAGMIYINVTQNGRKLCLDDPARIGVVIPARQINRKMKVFNGTLLNDTINWQNPVALLNNPDSVRFGNIPEELLDIYGFDRARFLSDSLGISGRSIPQFVDSVMQYYDSLYNEYKRLEDEVYYAFEANKIGWFNIDRFVEQNETEEVDFPIIVNNIDDFQEIFIKLVFMDLQSSINAFKINPNQFVFSKSASSKIQLPIGGKVIVLATAYRRGKPYYDMKEIIIKKTQSIELNLKKTSVEEFKKEIMKKF